ncbi:hypothetical protein GF325_01340 [Candidatus Bathyarchaeota archaeon]|nr:hypothetical protein [Candidatus Bathyarchaeota archaeon]
MNDTSLVNRGDIPIPTRILDVIIVAFLFGFGWHVRGSGTSDPTVVMLLFLLYVGYRYAPRDKFNVVTFGLAIVLFRALRRGWGTFVGQGGIPGLWDGHLISYSEGFDIPVAWWQGYFWLFIVGLAWAGPAASIIGGYFLTSKKYNGKDFGICTLLYFGGMALGYLLAYLLVPVISPVAYYDVYLAGLSTRNYKSMMDNFAYAFAMVPVLLYIRFIRKDKIFTRATITIMLIFGVGLSVADIWQAIGRNNPSLGLPFWSLWEYFSGFIIGALLMVFYHTRSPERWQVSSQGLHLFHEDATVSRPGDPPWRHLAYFWLGHAGLILYGLQESLIGMANQAANAMGESLGLVTEIGVILILIVDIPLYLLYRHGYFGNRFESRSFKQKCLLLLAILLPVYWLCYSLQFILTGRLFTWEVGYTVTWLDTISFCVVGAFLVHELCRMYWRWRDSMKPSRNGFK